MDFMGQQKEGFEQSVPRALRPAGQKRPSGNFLFFVVCMMSLFRLPRSKLPLAFFAVPAGKDGRVECPRQTVNDFIGIGGSVCGLFLFVQTHAPLTIRRQLNVIVPDALFLYESRKFYLLRHHSRHCD